MTIRRDSGGLLGRTADRRDARRGSSETLRQRLRRETSELHEAVEAQLDLLGPDLTVARYRRVLGILYGYWAPVEARLAIAAAATPAPLCARRPLLERDLVVLGLPPAQLPACTELPELSRREDVAGCLYVLEGARLGGQVIAREVERRLGITRERGAGFFAGDGRCTASRWRSVIGWLEDQVTEGASTDAIVGAACDTFRTLARWADDQGASR